MAGSRAGKIPGLKRAAILSGRDHLLMKATRRMQWPIGIPQKLPPQKHQVSLALADDLISLGGFRDQAHRGGLNTCFTPNTFSKGYLETRSYRNLCMRH